MKGQRERDLLRDIRLALKGDVPEKNLPELTAEYKTLCPGRPDVIYDIATAAQAKDRAAAERAFQYIARRGSAGGSGGDLCYAGALLHLAAMRYAEGAFDEVGRLLDVADRYVASRKPLALAAGEQAAVADKWDSLADFARFFQAVCAYRTGRPDEALRQLDKLSSYQLVLEPAKYALLILVKALAFLRTGQRNEALTALERRQSQEEAYTELKILSPTAAAAAAPPSSPVSRVHPSSPHAAAATPSSPTPRAHSSSSHAPPPAGPEPPDPVAACHDLHIVLLQELKRPDQARELFMRCKDYNRGPFQTFIQSHSPATSIGGNLIDSWQPVFPSLVNKRATPV